MKTLYSSENNFKEIYEKIRSDGKDDLHVLADFDRTLTYGSIDGVKTPSIISLLRDGNHLTEDYAEKAHALFDKYHPMEIDPNMPTEEKKDAMMKWWTEHNKLLVESGLKKKDLEDIVKNGHLKFREGVLKLLDNLYENNIPLVILSASGAGDAIQMFFEKHKKDYSNIHYVTNQFSWDNEGKVESAKDPIIHSLNKDESVISSMPEIYESVKDRRNVILLGDSINDVEMITGFDYNALIKVGLLNSDEEKLRETYLEKFDVVLEGDGDLNFVNELIEDIIS